MATSTISNVILDPSGVAVASVPVVVTLMPTAGFRTDTGNEVARTVSTTTDATGLWSLALERNSNITPAGTHYEVEEQIPAHRGGRRVWLILVGATNQTVAAALVTPTPTVLSSGLLTQAAADARYQALSAIGSDTPTTIDPDDAAAAGSSVAASRGDHQHAITAGTPVATGDANAEGAGTGFARDTHVHKGVVANEAWASWAPTLTNLTLGNGTVTAKFTRVGRKITFYFKVVFGSTSAMGTGPSFTLPVAPASQYSIANVDTFGIATLLDVGTAALSGTCLFSSGSTAVIQYLNAAATAVTDVTITATTPFTWAVGDAAIATGTYEASS